MEHPLPARLASPAKLLILLSLFWLPKLAEGQPSACVTGSRDACVSLDFYTGANLTAICSAPQSSPSNANRWSVALANLTNISVTTNVGTVNLTGTAQWWVGMTITVTGSATSALNKSYKVTAVSGSTATITTSGVSDGTYTDPVITTTNPVLDQKVWGIQIFTYDGSNNLTGSYWASSGINVNFSLACSSRATF